MSYVRGCLSIFVHYNLQKKIADGLPIDQMQAASNEYLNGIKKEVGEKKFGEMMLVLGGASLMFTVDTTGSMRDEIRAARGIAQAIINMKRDSPVDYILSPFNDPSKQISTCLLLYFVVCFVFRWSKKFRKQSKVLTDN